MREVLDAHELQHPNIIRAFHLDEVGGQSFFTIEYVPGRSLREIVEERKREGRTFALKDSEAVLMPVLKALSVLHFLQKEAFRKRLLLNVRKVVLCVFSLFNFMSLYRTRTHALPRLS